ncbi:MAG: flagellar basal body rod C-terminal domain-containing protein [Balneolaceae bacterium]
MFSTFQTAAKGLAVQREKIAVSSRNIANANTSVPRDGGKSYKTQSVQVTAVDPNNFRNLLQDSMTTLNRTHPRHLEPSESRGGVVENSGSKGYGPQVSIAESENVRLEYDPNHPDADEDGMVHYPDVDLVQEMTRMVTANRLYEANLSTIEAEKEIIKRSLEI